jgi:hypothetical protein
LGRGDVLPDGGCRDSPAHRQPLRPAGCDARSARASGGLITDWDINKVFASADAAVGVPVLSELYAQMKDKPVAPDLVALWHSLGVDADGNTVRLNDTAPLAAIRRAIFKST